MGATRGRVPGWGLDLLLAAGLLLVAWLVERQTGGRLSLPDLALVVGGGSFLLLRLGARLVAVGRTIGCLFIFAITWLLPCSVAMALTFTPDGRERLQTSTPLFLFLGVVLLLIMALTFERLRVADQARFAPPTDDKRPPPEPPTPS